MPDTVAEAGLTDTPVTAWVIVTVEAAVIGRPLASSTFTWMP